MIFVEMSRDLEHGGSGWEFPVCLWSPTRKEKGPSWPFWDMLLRATAGDIVLHLRGAGKAANFVGYSTVANAGYRTDRKPLRPGAWKWSSEFNRVDLTSYVPFAQAISLVDVFSRRRAELESYFVANKRTPAGEKRHIFYVIQSGRLQCLNGAYLSEVDEDLQLALFGDQIFAASSSPPLGSVTVGTQLREVLARIGQREFSEGVRDAYGHRCCFPGCDVDDRRFLVASHIARWADDEALRGSIGNGLCLCLHHDKAFETGVFWLEDDYTVSLSDAAMPTGGLGHGISAARGRRIAQGKTAPLVDAVRQHRSRVRQIV